MDIEVQPNNLTMLHKRPRTLHFPSMVLQLSQHWPCTRRSLLLQRPSHGHGDGGWGTRGRDTPHQLVMATGQLHHLSRGTERVAWHASGWALHTWAGCCLWAGHVATVSTQHLPCITFQLYHLPLPLLSQWSNVTICGHLRFGHKDLCRMQDMNYTCEEQWQTRGVGEGPVERRIIKDNGRRKTTKTYLLH